LMTVFCVWISVLPHRTLSGGGKLIPIRMR
jgi:hypothetical protein